MSPLALIHTEIIFNSAGAKHAEATELEQLLLQAVAAALKTARVQLCDREGVPLAGRAFEGTPETVRTAEFYAALTEVSERHKDEEVAVGFLF